LNIDIREVLVTFLALLISLTVHEFAHAVTADRLGDPTPRRHGRVTLNPIVIIRAHPVGALLLPLLGPALFGVLFAFASTPVNPTKVRRSVPIRKAEFLIALAGPVSNVILGVLAGGVCLALVSTFPSQFHFELLVGRGGELADIASPLVPLVELTRMMVIVNIILAIFNIIPIPPLDGFTVATAFWPDTRFGNFVKQYQMVLLVLFILYAGHLLTPVIVGAQKLLIVLGT
jgi:Zn-dependent protease